MQEPVEPHRKSINLREKAYSEKVYRAKLDWVLSLKTGDTVNDCRGKNLKISEIYDNLCLKRWTKKVIYFFPLPDKLAFWLEDMLSEFKSLTFVSDRDLILEDGAHCSAMCCCDPVEENTEENT